MRLSSRLGLDIPDGTDPVSAYPADAAQALTVLDNAAIYAEGTLAARPAAPASPASGRVYRATDTGQVFVGSGGVWYELERLAKKGVASGYCDLDSNTHVPASRIAPGTGALQVQVKSASFTAATGFLYVINGGQPLTVTLPAPAASAIVAVEVATGAQNGAVTVLTPSGTILGVGLNASSFHLASNGAFAVLQSDGTNWLTVGGGATNPTVVAGESVWVETAAGSPVLYDGSGNSSYLLGSKNLADVGSRASALLNLGVARGNATVTFSANNTSSTTTVSHGLSSTPTAVGITGDASLSYNWTKGFVGASTFQAQAATINGSSTSVTLNFSWIAIL